MNEAVLDASVVLKWFHSEGEGHVEVARQLRAGPGGPSVVLVAISGYGRDDDRGRAKAAGFDALVVKPASADEIAGVIAELTARNRVAAS